MQSVAGTFVKEKGPPAPSRTRSNGDWVMIVLGFSLIFLFLLSGYLSLPPADKGIRSTMRGPVKEPNTMFMQTLPDKGAVPRQK